MSEFIDDGVEFTDDEWGWACQRLPKAPQSVRILTLRALAAGWCVWDVSATAGRVTLRNHQHRERTGITYQVDLVWTGGKGGMPRFMRRDLIEIHDIDSSRRLEGAEAWLHPA